VIFINSAGARAASPVVNVGQGPTGLIVDDSSPTLYVLNKFDATISVVNTRYTPTSCTDIVTITAKRT